MTKISHTPDALFYNFAEESRKLWVEAVLKASPDKRESMLVSLGEAVLLWELFGSYQEDRGIDMDKTAFAVGIADKKDNIQPSDVAILARMAAALQELQSIEQDAATPPLLAVRLKHLLATTRHLMESSMLPVGSKTQRVATDLLWVAYGDDGDMKGETCICPSCRMAAVASALLRGKLPKAELERLLAQAKDRLGDKMSRARAAALNEDAEDGEDAHAGADYSQQLPPEVAKVWRSIAKKLGIDPNEISVKKITLAELVDDVGDDEAGPTKH